jgi:His/Glu/Gln/Arg/opine family amino acid ABC transporter permease subunit
MQFVLANQGLKWSDSWFLLQGALNTLTVTILAGAIGTIAGILLGWLRFAFPVARIGTAPAIDIVRSVPLVVQLVLLSSFLALAGHAVNPFWLGTLILSASMAVTTSEVVRGGLASVPPGYKRAARSLGMNYIQELRHVSAPLALRVGLAGWIGLLIALVKDSALISVVGYLEFLRSVQILITRTNQTLLLLAGVGLFYFVICYPVSRYSRRLERKVAL